MAQFHARVGAVLVFGASIVDLLRWLRTIDKDNKYSLQPPRIIPLPIVGGCGIVGVLIWSSANRDTDKPSPVVSMLLRAADDQYNWARFFCLEFE
jgi:hypothetical protein